MSFDKIYENGAQEIEEIKIDFYPDPDYQFQGWLRVYGKSSTLGYLYFYYCLYFREKKIFKGLC